MRCFSCHNCREKLLFLLVTENISVWLYSYGLLGPSGCGKTTLLRSVIGRLHIDSGHIVVLGDRPGARGHKVPGSMVGYMPQVCLCFLHISVGVGKTKLFIDLCRGLLFHSTQDKVALFRRCKVYFITYKDLQGNFAVSFAENWDMYIYQPSAGIWG